MIITRLQGGLGNQLFQYATALSLAPEEHIRVDASYYSYVKNRSMSLARLGFAVRSVAMQEVPVLFRPALIPVVGQYWRTFDERYGVSTMHYEVERDYYSYTKISAPSFASLYLDGFWQHQEYVQPARHYISKVIDRISLGERAQEYKRMMQSPRSVAVHVRRGDYTVLSSFGVCSPQYYYSAMKEIAAQCPNPQWYIFTDDPDWVQETLSFPNMQIVSQEIHDEAEELILMRSCRHHIIANSTFSWWGAFLSTHKGMTIAPTPWLSEASYDTTGMYLAAWKKIRKHGKGRYGNTTK